MQGTHLPLSIDTDGSKSDIADEAISSVMTPKKKYNTVNMAKRLCNDLLRIVDRRCLFLATRSSTKGSGKEERSFSAGPSFGKWGDNFIADSCLASKQEVQKTVKGEYARDGDVELARVASEDLKKYLPS